MATPPEVWLRGPLPGISPYLQPAAHALLQVREDVEPVVAALSDAELWSRPAGVASVGFHLLHLAGSIDRLLTYSRGEPLSPDQLQALAREKTAHQDRPDRVSLLTGLSRSIDGALHYFRALAPEALLASREVGRKRLPSTTLGLIVHAAEHASRHAGQIVTLGPVVRGHVTESD
ncbi:MAG TPA: DinB family protein [Gemmatimonadales bacterium]|nr:DinB family protein [Gemmatimonadales bacterium]